MTDVRHATLIRQLQGQFRFGAGSPESAVEAPPGTLYSSSDGTLYIKESGTGSTGWAAVTTGGAFAFFSG